MLCVYILHSTKLNRFYIGFTSDFETRLEFHKQAASHKFTAKADDWVLYYQINCETICQARKIEKHIKSMKSKIYLHNLKKHTEISEKLLEKYS